MRKKEQFYLAFDLGASSGRAVLGCLSGLKLQIKEINRFANAPVLFNASLYWDVLALWRNMLDSMRICVQGGYAQLAGIGVDTWGVDFGLLGKDGKLLGNPICYRDGITKNMDKLICSKIPAERIYQLTGLAAGRVTTLAQLMGISQGASSFRLSQARTLLMMPDFFRYLLSGDKGVELTVIGSSLLTNIRTGKWCSEIFTKLRLPKRVMPKIVQPASVVGNLRKDVCEITGLDERTPVIAVASHDTCSAAAAVPFVDDQTAFISSGTWSVLGLIQKKPITSSQALGVGFVNEFSLDSILFVKNMMGLYLFENLRRTLVGQGQKITYSQMIKAASQAKPFARFLDISSPVFFVSDDPVASANQFLSATGQKQLRSWTQLARTLLESLAFSYRQTLVDLELITGKTIRRICVVGGGSRNKLLCQMTADATGLEVIAGPAEATVVGNLGAQALAIGQLSKPEDIRELVRNSFSLKTYKPRDRKSWDKNFVRYTAIVAKSKNRQK